MDDAAKEPKKAFYCNSCGIDCTRSRFHYAKHEPATSGTNTSEMKYDLCPNCFLNSRFPSSHNAADFVKLEDSHYNTIPDRNAPWTDPETLLLLEGLENFDDNWEQIANHVGSRTREECVMKFLQLEIQDDYLTGEGEFESATMQALNGRDPITQLENPVMSVVAFLAQMTEPSVAAAAAGKSVAELRKGLRSKLEKGTLGAIPKDKGKEKEATAKNEDSMDIDSSRDADASDAPVPASTDEQSAPASLASVALATSAARSAALASHEEREMTRVVAAGVNLTLQKLEIKLAQFAELEDIVQAERRDLEKGRQQLFLDRMAFKKRVKEVQDAFQTASLKGSEEGLKMAQETDGIGMSGSFGFQPGNGETATASKPMDREGEDTKSFDL